jgi:excisionase family DNA binding protein
MKNRLAKTRQFGSSPAPHRESLSASDAARLLGISTRTLKRMCVAGQVRAFKTAGGHWRVARAVLENFQKRTETGAPTVACVSDVLQTKRERIEELALEAQERRAKREIRKLDEEDSEAERQRKATAQAEELERRRAIEETRLQATRDAAQRRAREREQEEAEKRREWMDGWVAWALDALPTDAPRETELDVAQAVEGTLSRLAPEQPQTTIQRLVLAAIEKALTPWRWQRQISEAVQLSRKELPFCVQRYFEPSEWEVKAMERAREAIRSLPSDSTFEQLRQAAIQAGRQIAAEYEAGEARARAQAQAERERQQRRANKSFLVSVGISCVSPYLSKLFSDGDLWDEDLSRKSEFEVAVRKMLEERLTGDESLEDVRRLAHELLDTELEIKPRP